MLYELTNLKKRYDTRTVLDVSELFIEKGKIYGLLGPNGSGKTTLLSILGFLNFPSEGILKYKGKNVLFTEKYLHALRRQVILVDQHPILFSTSVFKNVEFGLRMRKISGKERRRRTEEALERVGMRDFANAAGAELSGGETQRVAIARALACSPEVMLLDEPTASADASNRVVIEEIIRELHADAGISIIISTHNLLQASRLVHERIYLFQGKSAASPVCENIFSGPVLRRNGSGYCLANGSIPIPLNENDHNGNIRISINPASLIVHTFENMADNMEKKDILTGRILQLACENNKIRMVADVGIPLNVLMNQQEYRKSRFAIGDKIQIRCQAQSVTVIQPATIN